MTVESSNAVPVRPAYPAHLQAAITGALLLAAFWPIVVGIYGSWFDTFAYMEHGILVIPVAVCMAWSKRSRLRQIHPAPSVWGIVLLALGALQAMLGVAAHWTWVSRTALIVSLAGCIAASYGVRMLRELAYPMGTLLLMIAPPTFVYERITLGLQLLASRLGEGFLEAIGYPVLREGNILELVGTKLSIEEACSGIRSLPAIVFVTVAYDYFFVHGRFLRAFLLVMSVPIATLGNACRIIVTGILSQHYRELTQGGAHEALGYLSVAAAGIGCVLLHVVALYVQRTWRSRHA